MRLDKYLKISRLIKRRTVANEACDAGRVMINDKVAKASADVKIGDVIEIAFGQKTVKIRVLDIQDTTKRMKQRIYLNIFLKLTNIGFAIIFLKCTKLQGI